mmetsp:Transcript_4524/g.10487  ORF Transcript_4524/g.10487 Transcript_4524/m.10487 type:complete len:127 (-) Transcript_4524:332-712(-)
MVWVIVDGVAGWLWQMGQGRCNHIIRPPARPPVCLSVESPQPPCITPSIKACCSDLLIDLPTSIHPSIRPSIHPFPPSMHRQTDRQTKPLHICTTQHNTAHARSPPLPQLFRHTSTTRRDGRGREK